MSRRLQKQHHQLWMWAFLDAFILELLFWLFYAFLTFPATTSHPEDFFALSLPIIVTNTIAVSLFYMVIEFFIHQRDSEKTQTTKNTFDAVAALFATLHDGFNDANISKITELMISSLPSLIWTAVCYKEEFYTRTNYKTEADVIQGDAEIAILKLQKTLPDMPHLMTLPVTYKNETVGWIIAAKSKGDTFTKMGIEFLHGICHVMEAIYEYDKMKEEENLLAEAEIRALQAQINPHFLYNTLSTVQALCRIDPEKASEVTEKFAKYLRQNLESLDKDECIPIKKELEHTRIYSEIEMVRFPQIEIIYDIKDEDFSIPALSIQPMVENAIRHGVRIREHGVVSISTDCGERFHKIVIKDNGKGFDVKSLATMESSHIGVKNVKERIEKMCNGVVNIESTIGEGTTITIRIPK